MQRHYRGNPRNKRNGVGRGSGRSGSDNSKNSEQRNRSPSNSSEGTFSRHSVQKQRDASNNNFKPPKRHEKFELENKSAANRHYGKRVGFRALELLLLKDSEELILELGNLKQGIYDFIKTDLSNDAIVLLIKLLKKVSDSPFVESKYKVLQLYLDDIFLDKLFKYIVLLPTQKEQEQKRNKYFWNSSDEFWNNLVGICQEIYNTIPTFAYKVLPNLLESLLTSFLLFEEKRKQHISDELKDRVNKLNESIQILVTQEQEKNKVLIPKQISKSEGEPPDDFREISVYPTSVELLSGSPGFLRRNVVKGPYNDANHYLDVQFRLLREDFVGPLRSAINTYRSESTKKQRIENVRIYNKVRFLNQETINEQYCIRVQFDFSKNKRQFKYEESKRFMFGSLLCFTCDNFKSFIFGKVAQRELKDLEQGQVVVGFNEQVVINYTRDFLMIECGIYFEPYFHVLNVLREIDDHNFPMEKYIIRVDPTIQPPQYLTEASKITIGRIEFFPALANWPKSNFYNLNESQLSAFKAALTQEFSVIQGPPGTGKTFVGLKIAQTLLENEKIWFKRTPMLIICYTNHALDQFLEGLIPFTNRILRVGGQSKNENLSQFNLRNNKGKTSSTVLQQRNEVQVILQNIKSIKEDIHKADSYGTILNVFGDNIPRFHETWFYSATNDEVLDWLLDDSRDFQDNELSIEKMVNDLRIEDENKSDEESEEENENIVNQLDDIFDEVRTMEVRSTTPLITISSLRKQINDVDSTLRQLKERSVVTAEDILQEDKSTLQLFKLRQRYDYLTYWLSKGNAYKKETLSRDDFKSPHKLAPEERWNLYFYCLHLYKLKLVEKLRMLNNKFRKNYKIYEEMRDIENTKLMKDVLVVGITTTGAARLRSTLQALKSPIVIVEEAAEILEAHITSSLTQHCKHLILIGDHKQLKPSSANYSIEKFYNLGISLFERMVLNKIQLHTLDVQHRMRPEIASLISPTIYPDLQNHPSVNERPAIKGVNNCLFFIDHTNEEVSCEGTTSKKNFHEVEFLIYFARHLILNGYKPEDITILAAYLGQMFELQKEKKKHKLLGNMRIAVLDNYQGEECDIILLSLVRNNKENKIGFLSIENRVCVALSRARNGFYLMGNMNQLCEGNEMWRKIRQSFEQQNAIGSHLPLRCQIHPDKVTFVDSGSDFLNISEGGCNQKCEADLTCGHKCTSLCHVLDRKHELFRCLENCGKKLCDKDDRHLCQRRCYEVCGPCQYKVLRTLECGHVANLECHIDPETYNCEEAVSTVLPCGHLVDKPCYSDSITFRCPFPCDKQIEPCGHACEKNCHIRQDPDHLQYKCLKKCVKYLRDCQAEDEKHKCYKRCFEECDVCLIRVQKQRNCSHFYDVPCSSNVNDFPCEKPCKKILPCGHKCKNKCAEPCGNCKEKVEKVIPTCGHTIKMACSEEPRKELCFKKCPLKLHCGHPCTNKCRESCTTKCIFVRDCSVKSPCGHVVTQMPCYLQTDAAADPEILLKHCNHPCRDQLQCGHNCSGTCGECTQGRVHKRCDEKCGNPLVCNHPCEFPCRQACRPCTRPCPYKCKHSSCGKRCGDVCIPCKEKCPRHCRHQRCNKYCGEICEIPPCEQPCHKKLRCGHLCVGFCGDPCPPKCLICDKEELTEIFFGFEEEHDARYVLLEDCGHIFENTGLKQWMQQDNEEIGFKECPKCKTPIKTTLRYSDNVKQAKAEVAKVKKKINGSERELNTKRVDLKRKLESFFILENCNYFELFKDSFYIIGNRLSHSIRDRRQRVNKLELNAVESKLQIIEHMFNILKKYPQIPKKGGYVSQLIFILQVLNREENYITEQEIADLQFELNRLSRIVEFEQIRNSSLFLYHFANNDKIKRCVQKIEDFLFISRKFVGADEEKTKQLLKELNELVASGIGISDQERRDIVRAMGFRQGHWYKCPKGHPYCIADCGGAVMISKCPECGSQIGGRNHALLANNALAPEMDGARYAAYSDTANNMGNYQFNF